MSRTSIKQYYFNLEQSIRNKIAMANKDLILSNDVEQLVEHFIGNDRLETVELVGNPKIIKQDRRISDSHVSANILIDRNNGSGRSISFLFHFNINPISHLAQFVRLECSTTRTDGFESKLKDVGNSCIAYEYHLEKSSIGIDKEELYKRMEAIKNSVHQVVEWKNTEITKENEELKRRVVGVINKRKAELESMEEWLDDLIENSPFTITDLPDAPFKELTIKDKPILKVAATPNPQRKSEYSLNSSDVIRILEYLDRIGHTFEKEPCAVKVLGETDFRGLLLASLNGAFDTAAVGEAFIKNGKSDICLRIEKAQILVFELKIWGGSSAYSDAINQLLGYNTWRQSHGVLITFCRNKSFSNILNSIKGIITGHECYINGFEVLSENHFKSYFKFSEDPGRTIIIHHLLFNVYCDTGE